MNVRLSRRAIRRFALPVAILGAGVAASAAIASDEPPTNVARPSIAGVARDGETLQASPGRWTGSDPIGFAYRWQRCNTTPGTRNIALGRRAWASSELPTNAAGHAVDGNPETWWGAGDFAPQWIEIDLGSAHAVRSLLLTASQHPSGYTRHLVWGRGPAATDDYRLLAEFEGTTADRMQLSSPSSPGPDVQFVGVETVSSASWVAWREIEVFAECTEIAGATASTYTLTAADVGFAVRAAVSATNLAGSITAASDQTGPVAAVAPASLAPPVVEGLALQDELLTANPGFWRGTQPLVFAFHWQRCNRAGAECFDLDAGEIDTYLLGPADVGRRIRVRVTARNAGGTAEAVSRVTAIVAPLAVTRPCVVPNVRRKTLAAARAAIRRGRCAVGRIQRIRSRRARGRVVSQTPRPGTRRPPGTRVHLVVSRGRR